MNTGHSCTDCSFKCSIKSHASHNARLLFCFVGSHCVKRWLHSGRHCRNSVGATFMIAPTASSKLFRHSFSSSSVVSSSSSSCANSCGVDAALLFFALSHSLDLLNDSSIKLKSCPC